MHEAEAALMAGRVNAIVVLRQDFARQLRQPDGAPIQVIVNGVDANTARLILGYVQGVWQNGCSGMRRDAGRSAQGAGADSSSASGSTANCAAATFWCPAWSRSS